MRGFIQWISDICAVIILYIVFCKFGTGYFEFLLYKSNLFIKVKCRQAWCVVYSRAHIITRMGELGVVYLRARTSTII